MNEELGGYGSEAALNVRSTSVPSIFSLAQTNRPGFRAHEKAPANCFVGAFNITVSAYFLAFAACLSFSASTTASETDCGQGI